MGQVGGAQEGGVGAGAGHEAADVLADRPPAVVGVVELGLELGAGPEPELRHPVDLVGLGGQGLEDQVLRVVVESRVALEGERRVVVRPVLPELLGGELGLAAHQRHHRDVALLGADLGAPLVDGPGPDPATETGEVEPAGVLDVRLQQHVEGLAAAVPPLVLECGPDDHVVTHQPVQLGNRAPDRNHHLLHGGQRTLERIWQMLR